MANINKIYPHVNVVTRALLRTAPAFIDNEATTMFVPFYSRRGINNSVQKIFSLDQFIAEYGEPEFDYQGRTVLNIYNWLNAGGAIYALRLTSPDATKATKTETFGAGSLVITAKYPGEYYKDIELYVTRSEYSTVSTPLIDIQILLNGKRLQSLYRLKSDNFVSILNKTNFVNADITGSSNISADFALFVTSLGVSGKIIDLGGGSDGSFNFEKSLQRFLGSIKNNIETNPSSETGSITTNSSFTFNISNKVGSTKDRDLLVKNNWIINDIVSVSDGSVSYTAVISSITIIDDEDATIGVTFGEIDSEDPFQNSVPFSISFVSASESYVSVYKVLESKMETPIDIVMDPGFSQETKTLLKEFSEIRDDIFFYFSEVNFSENEIGSFESAISVDKINQAIYTQKFSVEDVISGKNIWVAPTFFLSRLIPNNDRIFGMQWPTAGLSRGVLLGVQGINQNPTADAKNLYYRTRINYVEKDSRGYKFMSQLTGEALETSLKFINNARVVNKIVRDLEILGQQYLFEFNDATTLNNMRAALNRYVTEWIQNRTLSFAEVTVTPNLQIEERVDVSLTIKFTGTIEIISIDITIE